ncbi:glutathione S-transferase family protein [Novosphingobium huizhouense]|uniref:glutathione S-transferase family protein n=1 Tax=Novosphingobium huizhouense TaxID=2866625 RepID=UPI001CD8D09C|nr:glutathione S-transferase family protein [Novosphingobium huizhouense]
MSRVITAFRASPDRGRGLARDMRVRWALEELGLDYAVCLVDFAELRAPAHLARNPFGQIPTLEDDGLVLFESGAIVLHLAQSAKGLLPDQPHPRARAINWMFAALNTLEPPILELESALLGESDKAWTAERRPLIEQRIDQRFAALSTRLGAAPWIDGAFSVGDLMLVSVLIRARGPGILDRHPVLRDYVARAEGRPAYQRAFAAQRAVYLASRG